jgi:uncharacterized membrane protein YedE/YeeE
MKFYAGTGLVGFALGFGLSRIGFSSWDEVHKMFVFADLRMLLTFMVACGSLLFAWRILARATGASWTPRRLHPGVIPGSLLFGAGWAIAGACPAIALVQIGEGQLGGFATLVGILAGNLVYPLVHRRFFGWPSASCRDD